MSLRSAVERCNTVCISSLVLQKRGENVKIVSSHDVLLRNNGGSIRVRIYCQKFGHAEMKQKKMYLV